MRITHAIAAAVLLATTISCGADDDRSHQRAVGSIASISRDGEAAPETSSAGTIKMVNRERGFGFITPDDGSPDVFVHHSGIVGEWPETGDRVLYDLEIVKGKVKAVRVRAR